MSRVILQIGSALVVPLAAPLWRSRALREAVSGGADPLSLAHAECDRGVLPRVIRRASADHQWRRRVRWHQTFRPEALR